MPLLALNPEHLLLLSSCAKTRPSATSPMRRLYLQVLPKVTGASQQTALTELATDKLIVANTDKKPVLAKQIELPMHVLHRPEQTLCLTRPGRLDYADVFFCRSGKLWVQNATTVRDDLELMAWPFDVDALATWFAEELLGDVQVAPGGADHEVRLTGDAFVVLCALQASYKRRIDEDGPPIGGSGLLVPLPELADPALLDEVHRVTLPFMSREQLTDNFADKVRVAEVLDELCDLDLVSRAGDQLAFARRARRWFDPGKQQAVVGITQHGATLSGVIVTAMATRWTIRVPDSQDPVGVRLIELPGSTPKTEVWSRVLEVLG